MSDRREQNGWDVFWGGFPRALRKVSPSYDGVKHQHPAFIIVPFAILMEAIGTTEQEGWLK